MKTIHVEGNLVYTTPTIRLNTKDYVAPQTSLMQELLGNDYMCMKIIKVSYNCKCTKELIEFHLKFNDLSWFSQGNPFSNFLNLINIPLTPTSNSTILITPTSISVK